VAEPHIGWLVGVARGERAREGIGEGHIDVIAVGGSFRIKWREDVRLFVFEVREIEVEVLLAGDDADLVEAISSTWTGCIHACDVSKVTWANLPV
jgi:hypothetical protein